MFELAGRYGMGESLPEILGEGIDMVKGLDQVMSQVAAVRAQAVDNLRVFNQGLHNEIMRRDAAAAQTAGVRVVDNSERRKYARRSLVAELSAALNIPSGSAERLLYVSELLVHELPATLTALSEGRISYRHANILVDQVACLDSEACADLEQAVLPLAETLTPTQFDGKARRIRERLHPESITERHAKSRADRRVDISAEHDGMAFLSANLPAPEAFGIYNKLTAQARSLQGADEKRTLSQLRADVMMDTVLIPLEPGEFQAGPYVATEVLALPPAGDGYLPVEPLPDPSADECDPVQITGLRLPVGGSGASVTKVPGAATGPGSGSATASGAGPASESDSGPANMLASGPASAPDVGAAGATGSITMKRSGKGRGARFTAMRPLVVVTVPVMTLLGHSDEPGELQGYGPIDPDTAREIAAHAPSFVRLLTHPETGVVLSMSKKRYRPPKDLRTWLQIRDETCRCPGCNRSALHCDIDHTLDWAKGGTTDHTNLAHLCKADHRLKHEFGWTVTQTMDGTMNWVSPTGHRYSTRPETPIHAPLPVTGSRAEATTVVASAPDTAHGTGVPSIDFDSPPPF